MENHLSIANIEQHFQDRVPKPISKLRYYSVLALLTEKNGELCFVLNKRAPNIHQPGDICFPGGRQELGECLKETALRETWEELGIPKEKINLFGKSDYLITLYGAMIQPFLGFVCYEDLRNSSINSDEVAEVFTVPLSYFINTPPEAHDLHWTPESSDTFPYERIQGGEAYPFSSRRVSQLFYSYKNHTIWGFTAQVIKNITDLITKE